MFLFSCLHTDISKQKMNSMLQGNVTKRYSCENCLILEGAISMLEIKLEQIRLKLFIVDEQKRQYEEYSTHLEEILYTYKAGEEIFEETSLNHTYNSNEKRNEIDETVSSLSVKNNDTYWRCFWCLREHGVNGVVIQDYSTHLLNCPKRTFF